MGLYGSNIIECSICGQIMDENYGDYQLHPETGEPVCQRCFEEGDLDGEQ